MERNDRRIRGRLIGKVHWRKVDRQHQRQLMEHRRRRHRTEERHILGIFSGKNEASKGVRRRNFYTQKIALGDEKKWEGYYCFRNRYL